MSNDSGSARPSGRRRGLNLEKTSDVTWSIGAAVWVAAATAVITQGFDGLAITLGLAGAFLLAMLVGKARHIGADGDAATAAERLLDITTRCGLALAAALLIAAELQIAATAIDLFMPGRSAGVIIAPILAVAIAAALSFANPSTMRWLRLLSLAALLTLVTAAVISLVARDGPAALLSIPAAADMTTIEAQLRDARLADPATLRAHTVPFLRTDMVNFASLTIMLAVGLAALGVLLVRGATTHAQSFGGRQNDKAIILAGLVLLCALPAIAVGAKRDLMATFAAGIKVASPPAWLAEHVAAGTVEACGKIAGSSAVTLADLCGKGFGPNGLLRWQDVVFLRDAPVFAASSAATSAAGAAVSAPWLFSLAWVLIALVGASVLAVGASPLLGSTGVARTAAGFIGAGAVVITASGIAASGLVETSALVALAAAVAGTLVAPQMLAGWAFRTPSATVTVAAITVGVAITISLGLASKLAPITAFDVSGSATSAPQSVNRRLQTLQSQMAAATTPAQRTVAGLQVRRIVDDRITWVGLKPSATGILGLTAALLMVCLGSVLTVRR